MLKEVSKIRKFLINSIFTFLLVVFSVTVFAQVTFENTIDLLNFEQIRPDLTVAYLTPNKIQLKETWEVINDNPIPLTPIEIGIIDTRIDGGHPEFEGVNFGSTSNLTLTTPSPFFQDPHGTQVIGIIGANNISKDSSEDYVEPHMSGILSGVKRLNYTLEVKAPRFLSTAFTDRLKINKLSQEGVKIINYSKGLPSILGKVLFITKKIENTPNILFIVAAGNDGKDASSVTPATLGDELDNVITVGVVETSDSRASFSNFGNAVNIVAFGVGVYTPTIQGIGNFPLFGTSTRNYVTNFSGTSASAPFVTGTAGLLKAINDDLTPAQIKQILTKTADPIFATGAELTKTLGSACDDGSANFRGCRLNALSAVVRVLPIEITSINPIEGEQGETLNVTVSGKHFSKNVTSIDFGTDITTNSVTVASGAELTANITISPSATFGTRNVTLTKPTPAESTDTLPNAFTIQAGGPQPPTPVTLSAQSGFTEIELSWTQNTDTDFTAYKFYRDTAPGIDENDTLIKTITDQSETDSFDSPNVDGTYFYRIFVVNTDGISTGSNEVSAVLELPVVQSAPPATP